MVLTMVVYMLKAARHMRSDIAAKVEAAAREPGAGAWIGVFAFVLVMIVREGMETALILSTLLFEQGSRNLLAGASARRCCSPPRWHGRGRATDSA